MNFTAQNASRKWAYGAFRRIEAAMVTVAVVALLLGMPSRAGGGGESVPPGALGRPVQGRIATASGARRAHAAVPLPKPRPAEAPSAERDKPDKEEQASPERQARSAGCARTPPAAIGLPAGADRCHRDCAQHPRHQGRRRLRGRGSGAAGGDRAAGQAAGFGEAGGDPALSHGVCAGRMDPQRYRAAGGAPRQRRLRSRQFRLVRVPRPQPHRRRQAFRARPRQRARRSRLQVRRRQPGLADRPHRAAGIARERAAFRLHAVLDRAGPGLGLDTTRTISIST